MTAISTTATPKAAIGATSAGISTLSSRPPPTTAPVPAAATVAPTTPPISAWEELEGNPRRQVTRFQAIAPRSPARTTAGVIAFASTTSRAIVDATSTETNAPAKLSRAAAVIATPGDAAPVETAVAITSKVSLNPLVNPNPSAAATTMTITASELTSF